MDPSAFFCLKNGVWRYGIEPGSVLEPSLDVACILAFLKPGAAEARSFDFPGLVYNTGYGYGESAWPEEFDSSPTVEWVGWFHTRQGLQPSPVQQNQSHRTFATKSNIAWPL